MVRRRTRTDGASPGHGVHPTRQALLDTTVRLLDEKPIELLTCDEVLEVSGISRGSLYHHFEDYPDLIEHALVARLARDVDESIVALLAACDLATSREDFRDRLGAVTRITQQPNRAQRRMDRLITFVNTVNSPRFRSMVAVEQQRLTDALAEVVATGQQNGWVRPDIDPAAAAVLLQAYTLGRVVDDLAVHQVDPEAWTALVTLVINRTLLSE